MNWITDLVIAYLSLFELYILPFFCLGFLYICVCLILSFIRR